MDFREFMVEGTELNRAKPTENIDRSVMMVTALSPVIGYDQAAAISCYAIGRNLTLKEAALAKGVSEELFDRVVDPVALTPPARPASRPDRAPSRPYPGHVCAGEPLSSALPAALLRAIRGRLM
jgi:aspartate ammonia-lyase